MLNLLCASAITVVSYVIDVLLVLVIMVAFILLYVKYSKNSKAVSERPNNEDNPTKQTPSEVTEIDQDTYILSDAESQETTQTQPRDNMVDHFNNQLLDLGEPAATELKQNAVVYQHQTEHQVTRLVKDEAINLTEQVQKDENAKIRKNSYDDSMVLLDKIKQESVQENKNDGSKKKATAKKQSASGKSTAAKKSTSAKSTSSRKKSTKN